MITQGRRRHRLLICIAALSLPGVLWMSVNAREQVPLMAAAALPGPPLAERAELQHWGSAGLLGSGELQISDAGAVTLAVGLSEGDAHPRSLLYWMPPGVTELNTESAATSNNGPRFLAALDGAAVRITLPDNASAETGSLLLWDVARAETRDRLQLEATP